MQERYIKAIKEAFEKGQFSKLKKKILENGNDSTNNNANKGSASWLPSMVNAILQLPSLNSIFTVAQYPL